MCSLGRFVRETDTGVVPVFAWRLWILFGMLPGRAPIIGAARRPEQTTGPADAEAGGHLQSTNGATWAPNQAFRAMCHARGAHAVIPSQGCRCGVYAFRGQGVDLTNWKSTPSRLVPGIVALWGTVLEYEDGYRAEMAYPAALILPPNLDSAHRESLEKCARLYRVPVVRTPDEDRGNALIPALR